MGDAVGKPHYGAADIPLRRGVVDDESSPNV